MTRRRLLRGAAVGAAAALAPGTGRGAGAYRVGVGVSGSAYTATNRALSASAEFFSIPFGGKKVVIKPNLVAGQASTTGITTDPEAVRAIIDQILPYGPESITIVEAGQFGAQFVPCGYSYFSTYDPAGRVRLSDLTSTSFSLVSLPSAQAWQSLYLPIDVLSPNIIFISVAKLKTHAEAVCTLSMKNLFALPKVDAYPSPTPYFPYAPRLGLHDRGLNQTIVDVTRYRPIHFGVIDGVVGLEGFGPVYGTPVTMNVVLAGSNPLALDRVGAQLMGIDDRTVSHFTYAARLGLGPASVSEVAVTGDSATPRTFSLPLTPVIIDYPSLSQSTINVSLGQTTSIRLWYNEYCARRVEVMRYNDAAPATPVVARVLRDTDYRTAGTEFVTWDGRLADGSAAPAGRYAVHVRALRGYSRPADAVAFFNVV